MSTGDKLKPSCIAKVKSKVAHKYLLKLNWSALKKDVLCCLYINSIVECHQLVLPTSYHAQVLQMMHDGQGHQNTDKAIALYWELIIGTQCIMMLLNMYTTVYIVRSSRSNTQIHIHNPDHWLPVIQPIVY